MISEQMEFGFWKERKETREAEKWTEKQHVLKDVDRQKMVVYEIVSEFEGHDDQCTEGNNRWVEKRHRITIENFSISAWKRV